MPQQLRTRASRSTDGAFTGIVVLAFVAFWAAVAVFSWQASRPYRLIVVELWELIPPGARAEVALGLALAGGAVLITLAVVGVVSKDEPARYGGRPRETHVGVDIDAADIDVSAM